MNDGIAIIDPSSADADLLKSVLESASFGYRCHVVPTMDALPALVEKEPIDLLLVDNNLADRKTLGILQRMKRSQRGLRIYLLADEVSAKELQRAQEQFIDGFCQKTADYPAIIDTIEETIV